MKKFFSLIISLFAFVFNLSPLTDIQLITSAFAQEKTASLEEIIVTATRTDKELENAPGIVSIITKKDIEKRHVTNIDELVNTVSGVFNLNRPQGMEPLVSLRGFPDQSRTLLMMDGVAMNNAYTGGVQFRGLLLPDDVERIEIVKGPFSSLYGGYAMGGVVNIMTKMPEKSEFTLKTGYGSSWKRGEGMDDLRKIYLSYGDRLKDKLSLFASYGYQATNGYPSILNIQSSKPSSGITGYTQTTDNLGNTRYLIGDKGDAGWWDDTIMFKAGYDFSKATSINASFIRSRYEYNYDDPHAYLRNAAGNEVWTYGTVKESSFLPGGGGRIQNIYNITSETQFSTVKAKLSVGLVDQENSWSVTPDSTATRSSGTGKVSETPSQSYNADIQFTLPIFDRHILTFGGSFRHGRADTEEHGLANWKDEKSKTALTYQSKGKD